MAKTRKQLEEEATELSLDPTEFSTNSEEEAPQVFGFQTTKSVSFNVNGKGYGGTSFEFESAEVAEARKQMLVERFGTGIIKENNESE